MKFFVYLALFFVLVWLFRRGWGARRRVDAAREDSRPLPPEPAPSAAEEIVACAHCGVHLPKSEAVSGAAEWFCGPAHRLAHEKDVSP